MSIFPFYENDKNSPVVIVIPNGLLNKIKEIELYYGLIKAKK